MPKHGFQFIGGSQPYVKDLPKGCSFAPRCEKCTAECKGAIPYKKVRNGRVRCLYAE